MCGKLGHFTRDYQLNIIQRNETLVTISKQFNITIKEYPIEASNKESKPQEEILGILDNKT